MDGSHGGINAGYIDFTGMTYKVSVTDVFGNVSSIIRQSPAKPAAHTLRESC